MKTKLPVQTEHQIQSACIEYLRLKKFFVFRLNSGHIRTQAGSFMNLMPPGTPDLMAFRMVSEWGQDNVLQLYFFEVKRPKLKPTLFQEMMMNELTEYGASCHVIHSIEELEALHL